jgi:large repetitive protein
MKTPSPYSSPNSTIGYIQGARKHRGRALAAICAISGGIFSSAAQGDFEALGDEFLIDLRPEVGRIDVSMNKHGEFVIAYDHATPVSPTRVGPGPVFARRYGPGGESLGEAFQASNLTLGSGSAPAVALHHTGQFVIAWNGALPGIPLSEIWARRYDSAGNPLTDEFQVNTFVTGVHAQQDIAMDHFGNFIVTWTQFGLRAQNVNQDGSGAGVFAQRYNWRGEPVGAEFQVNSITQGSQSGSKVAMDLLGNSVLAWNSPDGLNANGSTSSGVFARLFDRRGRDRGIEFLVNEHTDGTQSVQGIAADQAGRFAVLWTGIGPEADGGGAYVRLFDENGSALTPQLRVNPVGEVPISFFQNIGLAMEPRGNFVVSWNVDQNILAQVFDPAGAALSAIFQASSMDGVAVRPGAPALNKHGELLISWTHPGGATAFDPEPIFAQLFQVQLRGSDQPYEPGLE